MLYIAYTKLLCNYSNHIYYNIKSLLNCQRELNKLSFLCKLQCFKKGTLKTSTGNIFALDNLLGMPYNYVIRRNYYGKLWQIKI